MMTTKADTTICLWQKRSEDPCEYEFWKGVLRQKWAPVWEQHGIVVPRRIRKLAPPRPFYLEIPHRGEPLSRILSSTAKKDPDFYSSILVSFWKIYQCLEKHHVVHGDIHLQNVLYEHGTCFLIDFGLASSEWHRPFLHQEDPHLHSLYRWSREDLYRFLVALRDPNVSVRKKTPKTDFRSDRARWRSYFSQHPHRWTVFRHRFRKWFLGKPGFETYQALVPLFLRHILGTSGTFLTPTEPWHPSAIKLLLERFAFFFQLGEMPGANNTRHLCIQTFIQQHILSPPSIRHK